MNGKKYCIWCGNELTAESKFCPKCGKEQVEKENQLIDWLVSKTKDKLKGDAESNLIEALKNFIISHLYGAVMTVSIIAASVVTIYAGQPYINKVDANEISYQPAIEDNSGYTPPVNLPYDNRANDDLHSKCSRYLTDINNVGQTYFGTDQIVTVEDLKVPENSGLRGVYEVAKDDRFSITSASYGRTEFDPALHSREISKKLTSQGYDVGESIVEEWNNEVNGIQAYRKIIFVFVKTDGQWLMAENRILELKVDEAIVPGALEQDFVPEFTLDGTGYAYNIMRYLDDLYQGKDLSNQHFTYSGYTPEHDMMNMQENGVKEATISISAEVLDSPEDKYADVESVLSSQGSRLYQTKAVLDIVGTLDTKMKQTYTVLFVETGAELRILDTIITEDAIIF